MYSFLVCACDSQQSAATLLGKSSGITKDIMPSLGKKITSSHRIIPEINGGWFYLYPENITGEHLITEFADDNVAVIVFGDIILHNAGTAAQHICDVWRQDGVDAVRNLDGCFSAVIVDRSQKTLYVVSDLMGRRTLHYFNDGGTFLISPHDVAIVATGLCPLEYDLESAASIVACGWSLQGKPLLKKLNACDPNEYLSLKEGRLEKTFKPMISVKNRIEVGDKKQIDDQIDLIIEKLRDNARQLCSGQEVIGTGLTAGLDSRASLAILLSVVEPSLIKANTSGARDNFEVKTARKLAKLYGFSHEFKMPQENDADAFMPHSRLLAFLTNGDTNSKRAIHPLPMLKDNPLTRFHGSGGELFRGFTLGIKWSDEIQPSSIRSLLENRFLKRCDLPWVDSEIPDALQLRISKTVESLSNISSSPYDVLYFFYLYERYGRWASMVMRATWAQGRHSLFDCSSALRAAYKLPAPISNNCLLHRTILKRYTPEAYRLLVNRQGFLPLMSYPGPYSTLARCLKFSNKVVGKIRKVFGLGENVKSSASKWAEISARFLGPVIKDMLMSDDSISTNILSEDQLRIILDEHISMQADHLQMLGGLVTIEQWRMLMEDTAKATHKYD